MSKNKEDIRKWPGADGMAEGGMIELEGVQSTFVSPLVSMGWRSKESEYWLDYIEDDLVAGARRVLSWLHQRRSCSRSNTSPSFIHSPGSPSSFTLQPLVLHHFIPFLVPHHSTPSMTWHVLTTVLPVDPPYPKSLFITSCASISLFTLDRRTHPWTWVLYHSGIMQYG